MWPECNNGELDEGETGILCMIHVIRNFEIISKEQVKILALLFIMQVFQCVERPVY